jgi:hypothetical protein
VAQRDVLTPLAVSAGGLESEARLEALLPDDGLYLLRVLDRRNLGGGPDPVGAEGQAYQLRAERLRIQGPDLPPPKSAAGRIPGWGKAAFFGIPASMQQRVQVDLSALGDPLDLDALLVGPGSRGVLARGEGRLVFFPGQNGRYQLAVSDRQSRQTGQAGAADDCEHGSRGDGPGGAAPG